MDRFIPNWLLDILANIAMSPKTQRLIIIGIVGYFGITLLGIYMTHNFHFESPMFQGMEDVIRQKLIEKYDKWALTALVLAWAQAFRRYQKDKNRWR